MTFFDSVNAFLDGQVAMVEQWADVSNMANDKTRSKIVDDWGIAPLPNFYSNQLYPINAGWSMGISKQTDNQALASAFVRFAFQPSMRLKLNTMYGSSGTDPVMPLTLNSVAYQDYNREKAQVEQQVLPRVQLWFKHEKAPELLKVFANYISKAISGDLPIEQALASLEVELDSLLLTEE
ncbi:extracellular solute-binding protein [Vibrio sonorensis]|uniref:extracellular solute-binding protein n=1 Tax=Vibrio sonorensis TaxID=1004316 RepID=UPI0008DA08D9|nr:extracellular solute-binding protein [Vibrio sonorensis]